MSYEHEVLSQQGPNEANKAQVYALQHKRLSQERYGKRARSVERFE